MSGILKSRGVSVVAGTNRANGLPSLIHVATRGKWLRTSLTVAVFIARQMGIANSKVSTELIVPGEGGAHFRNPHGSVVIGRAVRSKRWRATALRDASAMFRDIPAARRVLEYGSPEKQYLRLLTSSPTT